MLKRIYFIFLVFISFSINTFAQGIDCDNADPFCAGGAGLVFPNSVGVPDSGPISCLSTSPNPAWFYLEIDQAGDLTFTIQQSTGGFDASGNPIGVGLDVDFVAWGPFSTPASCGLLQDCAPNCGSNTSDPNYPYGNVVDCSYDPSFVENMTILNASVGDVYLVLITNFSGVPGYISLTQTNEGQPGAGATDCSIVIQNQACQGETLTLDATTQNATNYQWFFDDGTGPVQILNGNFPTINATSTGTYNVTITLSNGTTDSYTEFHVLIHPNPDIPPVPDIELCDDNADGQMFFDLTQNEAIITQNEPNPNQYIIDYYASATDLTADNPILNPGNYQNTIIGQQTIFVLATDADTGCETETQFDIIVNPDPDVPATISDLELCDDDTDGIATFDLTDREGDIMVNQPTGTTYDVSYYASASDRTNGVPITSETAYPSTSATIYVLVEDTATSCTTDAQFDIVVNPLPNVAAPVPSIEECDDDSDGLMFFDLTENEPFLTQNAPTGTTYTVTYYSDAGHTTAITTPTNHQNNPANQQTIYVLVSDAATGCETSAEFEIIVNAQLPTTAPAPYELCDGDGDGQATFDLTTLDNQISTDPTYSYSYHATQADAQAGTPTVANNYTTGSTTIYVRVESSAVADCYNVVPAQLVVVPDPVVPTVPDLELCDDNTDGQETFDLTQNEPTIVQNEPAPGDYTVTYYASQNDLNNGNAITTPTAYTNTTPDQQTIYVVVEDSNTACTSQAQFDIIVNPIPAYNAPAPLIICDDGGGTGMAEFDLTDATTQITGNAPNLNVSYFETQLGAENNDPNDEIGPLYTNTTPYNQTVWVRVYDINTGCYAVDSMDLQVNDAPIANTPPPFIYCDDDNDGVGQFILTDLDDDINNDPNVTITYHQTQANADNDVIPLSSPFTNTVNTTQTIYVRVEAPGISCYTTIAITLQVEDSPQPVLAQDLEPLEACDANGNGSEVFDLTLMEADILANETNPSDFTVRYYTDAAYTQEITVPTAYTSNGMNQTIYVVVEGLNGCTGETSFELIVHPMPSYQHPQPLELCDVNNPGDEMEAFTLEDATLDITNGDNSLEVTYYATQADADAGTNPLTSPYT
ncbi:PKD domain-containing protein, partial [Mesonia sp. K7]|uniref:PKD domain-containing protein n=1 Tax=Mesonia sp. K7 TaxID=2218606 RepID=UPI000DB8076C